MADSHSKRAGAGTPSLSAAGGMHSQSKFRSTTNVVGNQYKQFKLIKGILSKPAEQRSTYELRTVLTPLMADIAFFKERKLKPPDIQEVCVGLQYLCKPKNSFVIKYGEEGELFYIILKGRVSVWVPVPFKEMRKPMRNFSKLVKEKAEAAKDFHFIKKVLKDAFEPKVTDDQKMRIEEEDLPQLEDDQEGNVQTASNESLLDPALIQTAHGKERSEIGSKQLDKSTSAFGDQDNEQNDSDWATFDDFEKYQDEEMTQLQKKNAWNSYVRERALETMFEAEKYLVRNMQSFVTKEQGVFTDVSIRPQQSSLSRQVTNNAANQKVATEKIEITESSHRVLDAETSNSKLDSRRQTNVAESKGNLLSDRSVRSNSQSRESSRQGLSKPESSFRTTKNTAFLDAEVIPAEVAAKLRKSQTEDRSFDFNFLRQSTDSGLKIYKDVESHQFRVDGTTYEWMDGMYFKKINEKYQEDSFGETALISKKPRNATIKTIDEPVHFATLSLVNYSQSLMKIEQKKMQKLIEFLQNIPCFKSQTRKAIQRYSNFLKPLKFTRGQTVYHEGSTAHSIYIVYKGEFELAKKLPRPERIYDGANLNTLGNGGTQSQHNAKTMKRNILAKRLPEIKDLPYHLKLSIFGRGSLMGEEDVFSRSKFSCTLKCHSSKGKVFELPKDKFDLLKQSEQSWLAIMEKIIQKESRQQATHLCNTPRNFDREDQRNRDKARVAELNKTIMEETQSIGNMSPSAARNISQGSPKMSISPKTRAKNQLYASIGSVRSNSIDPTENLSPIAHFKNTNHHSAMSLPPGEGVKQINNSGLKHHRGMSPVSKQNEYSESGQKQAGQVKPNPLFSHNRGPQGISIATKIKQAGQHLNQRDQSVEDKNIIAHESLMTKTASDGNTFIIQESQGTLSQLQQFNTPGTTASQIQQHKFMISTRSSKGGNTSDRVSQSQTRGATSPMLVGQKVQRESNQLPRNGTTSTQPTPINLMQQQKNYQTETRLKPHLHQGLQKSPAQEVSQQQRNSYIDSTIQSPYQLSKITGNGLKSNYLQAHLRQTMLSATSETLPSQGGTATQQTGYPPRTAQTSLEMQPGTGYLMNYPSGKAPDRHRYNNLKQNLLFMQQETGYSSNFKKISKTGSVAGQTSALPNVNRLFASGGKGRLQPGQTKDTGLYTSNLETAQIASLPGFIKVSFEFDQPTRLSKAQVIKRDFKWNKNSRDSSNKKGAPFSIPMNTKRMPVAGSIRPLPRRSVNIQHFDLPINSHSAERDKGGRTAYPEMKGWFQSSLVPSELTEGRDSAYLMQGQRR